MSEKHHLGRPSAEEFESEQGNYPDRQMEAQPGVFDDGQVRDLEPNPDLDDVPESELYRYGDSRPDLIDPESAHFVDISEDPRMTTMRDGTGQPEIHREDPVFLASHRVDLDDEIVTRPTGVEFSEVEAVLRPRVSKKGDESEAL